MNPERRNQAKQVLQRLRETLADMSRRNRFLNFNPEQSLEFTHPDLDTIFKHLVDAQKVIPILRKQDKPIKKNGNSTVDNIPTTSASRYSVEVARFSEQQLEGILRKIHNQYQSHLEESGCNALFLSFGQLQWFEQGKSEKTNIAPLLLVPVSLEKQFGETCSLIHNSHLDQIRRLTFSLSYPGETICENSALLQFLRRPEFNLYLPRFQIDSHSKPSEYLQEVKDWLGKAPSNIVAGWKIFSTISLAILPTSSQAMHRDLDPSAWPGEGLLENPNVVSLLIGEENSNKEEFSFEDIDKFHRHFDKMPTVLEADGSQSRALIRVLKGSNLVIEGPPGTGKSQTIANMIALALHQGKSVLFVAEKMEALKVVRARLDEVGLGNFCLELHSRKSTPKEVIAQIRKRLNLEEVSASANLDNKITKIKDRIIQCAEVLNAHCRVMANTIPELNLTVSQLAGKLESSRQKLQLELRSKIGYQTSLPIFIPNKNPSLEELEEVKRRLQNFGKHISEQIHLNCLAWEGFEPFDLTDDDCGHIIKALRKAKENVEKWEEAMAVLPRAACLDLISRPIEQHEELARSLEKARPPQKMFSTVALALSRSSFNATDYNVFINKMRKLREHRENIAFKIAANEMICDEFFENSEQSLKHVVSEGFGEASFCTLKQLRSNAANIQSILEKVRSYIEIPFVSSNFSESIKLISRENFNNLFENGRTFILGDKQQSIGSLSDIAVQLQTRFPEFSNFIAEVGLHLEGYLDSDQTKNSHWFTPDKIDRLIDLGWGNYSLSQLKQLHQLLTQAITIIQSICLEMGNLMPCLTAVLTPEVLKELTILLVAFKPLSTQELNLLLPSHFEPETIKLLEQAQIRHGHLNGTYAQLANRFKMDCLPSLDALVQIRERLSNELNENGKVAAIGKWFKNALTGHSSLLLKEISNFVSSPVIINNTLISDLKELENFLKEDLDFLNDTMLLEKLGPYFLGRNTMWADINLIVQIASQLVALFPMFEKNQLVVEILNCLKNGSINSFQIEERINDSSELLNKVLPYLPKCSNSQTLLSLASSFLAYQKELEDIFEQTPYDEFAWNVSCEILSEKIAEANYVLAKLSQRVKSTSIHECQHAIDSLFNIQMIISDSQKFNNIVNAVEGIIDFIFLIPVFKFSENLYKDLKLEHLKKEAYDWITNTLTFCEGVKNLSFSSNHIICDIIEELNAIDKIWQILERNLKIAQQQDILKALEDIDNLPRRQLLSVNVKEALSVIDQAHNELASLSLGIASNALRLGSSSSDTIIELRRLIGKVDIIADQIRILGLDSQETLQTCLEQIHDAKLLRKYITEIEQQSRLSSFLDEHYNGFWQTELDAIENTVQWADHVIKCPLLGSNVIPWMIGEGAELRYASLLSGLEDLKSYQDSWIEALNYFELIGKVDPDSKISFRNKSRNLATIRDDLSRALADVKYLPRWVEYQRSLVRIYEVGCNDLVNFAIEQNLQGNAPVLLAEAAFYQQWMKEITSREHACRIFNRIEHEGVREEFATLDRELPSLSRQLVLMQTSNRGKYAPKGNNKGFVSDYSEMGLLQHEITKERRFQPVRDIIDRAGHSLRSLMPCWLMSPQSVAQFIAPGGDNFDLLIMDEASQIRPEEALGSIARARQVVIVGDSMQMPPSRLFESLDEDDSEGPKAAMEVVESILQRAKTCFPVERLRWHYRSKHESLILFSNSRYYENQLIIPPSTHYKHPDLGIKLNYCQDASYKGSLNESEAVAVVDCLVNHVLTQAPRPLNDQESVIVIAMNEKQRDLIEDFFDNRLRNNSDLLNAYEMYREKGRVQIKNLESIQGDERDVVIISLTYGPEPGSGVVRQRFTSLTHRGGSRRLNVLLTRARKRMHIFSSLKSEQLHVGINHDVEETGLSDFKAFLRFAESGFMPEFGHITDRPPDSEFEQSVARYIEELGYEAHYQVGVDGFRIDIGVRDPKCPGSFIVGIECDGEPYHSHPLARERDRWREEILQKRGWSIYRIWSLDWYRNRTSERERLSRFLKDRTQTMLNGV